MGTTSFHKCEKCEKEIKYGEAYVSVTRSIETAEHDILHNSVSISVIEATALMTLCGKCGNAFDSENIYKILLTIPLKNRNLESN